MSYQAEPKPKGRWKKDPWQGGEVKELLSDSAPNPKPSFTVVATPPDEVVVVQWKSSPVPFVFGFLASIATYLVLGILVSRIPSGDRSVLLSGVVIGVPFIVGGFVAIWLANHFGKQSLGQQIWTAIQLPLPLVGFAAIFAESLGVVLELVLLTLAFCGTSLIGMMLAREAIRRAAGRVDPGETQEG